MSANVIRLSNVCTCEVPEPLTEFRLFAFGVNESAKGPLLFDDLAAQSVMASYAKGGVDLMCDLEHLSLDSTSPSYNPDAMGWGSLEVRGGELWVVNQKWTSEGDWRIRDKRQRYVSPACMRDDSGRVTELLNIALVAMPATYQAQELIAASRLTTLTKDVQMNPKTIQEALDALIAGDAEACMAVLKSMLVAAVTGETPPAEDAPPADETPAAAEGASAEAGQLSKDASALMLTKLLTITGATDPTEALQILETWSKAQAEVKAQREGLELSSRRMLIASLVKLGVETPATAWQGNAEDRTPVARLSAEPLADLRLRVQTLSATRTPADHNLTPGNSAPKLTEKEVKLCKARGVSEETFLANKAAILSKVKG